MRIAVIEFISLDGVVQAPGGPEEDTDGGFAHGGWSHPFFDDALGEAWDAAMGRADALLFGRRTWQVMAAAWPDRAGQDPFADAINAIRKYVVSGTLTEDDLTWENSTLVPGEDAMARIRELKAGDGGDLLVLGSAELVRSLVSEDLVDELTLMIEPVLLGGGKTIFPADGDMRTLELVSSTTSGTGVHVATYRRASEA